MSERRTRSPSVVDYTHHVPAEDIVPEYQKKAGIAADYPSFQAGLFKEDTHDNAIPLSEEYSIETISTHMVGHLKDQFGDIEHYDNNFMRTRQGMCNLQGYDVPITHEQQVMADIIRKPGVHTGVSFIRAGPRRQVVFHPGEVKAAIVTCGGLCPGLNDVIQELVSMLHWNYSVDQIFGIKCGFRGFYDKQFLPYMQLTPENTKNIYQQGGTILSSSRGGFDGAKIIEAIAAHGFNQVYVIGGDGSHRGAKAVYDIAKERGLKICVVGIPKTVDNDIGLIDRSFGFNTAVAEATKAVLSARVEAECTPNGIGIVKLMGRHAGFIAAHATLASRNVDLCLIPEIPIILDGVFKHIESTIQLNGHCVIVVAEGAGQELMATSGDTDESGNSKLPPIGIFLKDKIQSYFKHKGVGTSIKYIDPSYQIRSVPAIPSDSYYCMILAQNAVHCAMAGYTGFSCGLVNNRTCMIPLQLISDCSPTFLRPNGRTWERIVRSTHQPRNWKPESQFCL